MIQTKHPEVERIIQKYGEGFDTIYFDGKADAKLEIAQKGLREGIDEDIISHLTGLPIDKIKEIKRKL